MKRIIDMPEEDFDLIKNYANWYSSPTILENIEKAIINGTPLDEMIAEIESAKHPIPYEDDYDKGVNVGLRIATQAIHKYCDKEQKDV